MPVNIVDFDSVKVSFPQLLESFERLAEVGGTKRAESCFILDSMPLNRQNTLVAQCVHR